ncbi:XisH family protein [Phormidesmis sp. 146-33]
MSAKDVFHKAVRSALEKDGWLITADPLYIKASPQIAMDVDLGAEKLLAAERSGKKIAVEIKSFLGLSAIHEFHLALGQFLNYRLALEKLESERTLYLAIPEDAYLEFFVDEFIQQAVEAYQLNLIIFNPAQETIEQWKNQPTDS